MSPHCLAGAEIERRDELIPIGRANDDRSGFGFILGWDKD
jgi:hypothetical protein